MKDSAIRQAAKRFSEYWKDKGYEKGETHRFWLELLGEIFGVENPTHYIEFEKPVVLSGHTSFIDAYIPETRVLIEQKGINIDLRKPAKQSDGQLLTPFEQAKRYENSLAFSEKVRWIVVCNFKEFLIYDMERPTEAPISLLLKDLEKQYYLLAFLLSEDERKLYKETQVSIDAGKIVGQIYDALKKKYIDPENEHSQKSLNILCVRLVFCLYAEDAGLFGEHNMFCNYLRSISAKDARRAIMDLFEVLNTEIKERDPYIDGALSEFPYVNGGLFSDMDVEIPQFDEEIINILTEIAGSKFDWSEISPTIFGAVFESTLNPETRRSGGMHYTSIENIHKVIDPLFLDVLRAELDEIKATRMLKDRIKKLEAYRSRLSNLTFLDPACGSGNFLTETYISLRKLENEAIRLISGGQQTMHDTSDVIKVSIGQFYGIEINDFAVTVAKTALWIAESQMMKETEDILSAEIPFFPLKSYANIVEGNALRLDWEEVVPKHKLSYIMGNPPFVGARLMSKEQKEDLFSVFGSKWKNAGNLDYVSCWYKIASDMMVGTTICSALVSTNSVSQGESVPILWKPLFENGVHIDFAHRTFRWDSESYSKAHVHCVIIGFSTSKSNKTKLIYSDGKVFEANNINGYLIDADNVFVESRTKPICDVPNIGIGNKPIDGGFYLFTAEEKEEFIKSEPRAEKFFRLWYGSYEFINNKPRYCLWLGCCTPSELKSMPKCLKRVEQVRDFRLKSKSQDTVKLAEKPTRFHVENMPESTYIIIPETSSEKRKYTPIGFLTPDVLCSNAVRLVPNATLYNFGILTSNVHMAWMRAVCGRLETRYRYSKDIVYNNFPWCTPTDEQKQRIEQTAQGILDARALYPDCSLADLYDELAMPPELRKAHQDNDRAVMQAYGFDIKTTTESSCVAELMKMYQKLIKE